MRDEGSCDEPGGQRLDLNVLLRLWGKTGKKPGTYHPLLFHMLDVGADTPRPRVVAGETRRRGAMNILSPRAPPFPPHFPCEPMTRPAVVRAACISHRPAGRGEGPI